MRRAIIDFIYRIATGKRHLRLLLAPVFAAGFLFLILLMIFLARWVDGFFSLSRPLTPPWDVVVSVPLIAIGGLLWFWSVLQFARAGGTPVPVSPPAKLIDTGPYAYIRNPMLSGVFLLLFAVALLIGSSSLLFFFTPAFMVGSILEFKWIEEPELEERLGEKYIDYKRKTPLLIPKFFRSSQ